MTRVLLDAGGGARIAIRGRWPLPDAEWRARFARIAAALEDAAVVQTLTGGAHGGILLAMTFWADHPRIVLPWQEVGQRTAVKRQQAEGDDVIGLGPARADHEPPLAAPDAGHSPGAVGDDVEPA